MKTIQIGSQVWTKKNLRVFKFRNGDIIPIVQGDKQWSEMTSAAMCINPDNGECYYNWYAVNDPRGLAPIGFHVPSDEEWEQLIDECGGNKIAGYHLKSKNKWNGSNTSGFSGLPAGFRYDFGIFNLLGYGGYWWSSSPIGGLAVNRNLNSGYSYVYRSNDFPQGGFSVRLIKDAQ